MIATISGRCATAVAVRIVRASSAASSSDSSRGVPGTTLSPSASAPARDGRDAHSPRRATPQILTNGRRATLAGSVGAAPAATNERTDARRVRAAHEGLADQRAVEALRPPAGDGLRALDPGLGDDHAIVRHERSEAAGTVRVDRRASAGPGC